MNPDLARRFAYRQPGSADVVNAHQRIRTAMAAAAEAVEACPPGREQSVALTKIEEAMFWANAAIARNQP